MKIQCNACEAAEAKVLCCADEAALCLACDEKVHAANKLAGKHQRVLLLPPRDDGGCGVSSSAAAAGSSSRVPKCDICQEVSGYFFCLEDRALLCRKCDVSVHASNPHVAAHQRFLVTGVQVGLEPFEPIIPVVNEPSDAMRKTTKEAPSVALSKIRPGPAMSVPYESNLVFPSQVNRDGSLMSNNTTLPSFNMAGSSVDWPLDEFFGLPEFHQSFGFTEHASSKAIYISQADNGKLGSSDGSPFNSSADEELDANECLGQVPDCSWKVPEIPSPPTASGLHWQRSQWYPSSENAAFVPDISSSPSPCSYFPTFRSKRRRQL